MVFGKRERVEEKKKKKKQKVGDKRITGKQSG